jgi:hypothetical protein
MSGKYDPPNKAQLIAQFRRTPCVPELMVAAAETQFPPKAQDNNGASRANVTDEVNSAVVPAQARKRGRKPVVTPEKVQVICDLLSHGETERGACIRAGIGSTAWNAAKRVSSTLRDRIASARDDWARLRHQQHAAALYESQSARDANHKVLKPYPTYQAKLVVWHLTYCVTLNFAAIPEAEIVTACERFHIHLETWRRQEHAFGLMRKVYAKRAAIRGEQPTRAFQWNGWTDHDELNHGGKKRNGVSLW